MKQVFIITDPLDYVSSEAHSHKLDHATLRRPKGAKKRPPSRIKLREVFGGLGMAYIA